METFGIENGSDEPAEPGPEAAPAPQLGAEEVPPVDLADTLAFMQSRKSMRRQRGTYHRTRPWLTFGLFTVLLLLSLLVDVSFNNGPNSLNFSFSLHLGRMAWQVVCNSIFWILVVFFLFYLVYFQIKFYLSWSLALTAFFIGAQITVLAVLGNGNYIVQESLLGGYIGLQLVFMYLHFLTWKHLPSMQRSVWWLKAEIQVQTSSRSKESFSRRGRTRKNLRRSDTLHPPSMIAPPEQEEAFSAWYAGPVAKFMPPQIRARYLEQISYRGSVDLARKPHGYGVWADTDWHGERVQGIWEHGILVGPFKARETGSGSAFVNVRLGYVQNRRDQPEKWGTCHPVAATAGIAGVECSTSGVFFQTFPNVTMLTGPWPAADVIAGDVDKYRSRLPRLPSPRRSARGKEAKQGRREHLRQQQIPEAIRGRGLADRSLDCTKLPEPSSAISASEPDEEAPSTPAGKGNVAENGENGHVIVDMPGDAELEDSLPDPPDADSSQPDRQQRKDLPSPAVDEPSHANSRMFQKVATKGLEKIKGPVAGVNPGRTMINIVQRIDKGLEGYVATGRDDTIVVTADPLWGILISGHQRPSSMTPSKVTISLSSHHPQTPPRDGNSRGNPRGNPHRPPRELHHHPRRNPRNSHTPTLQSDPEAEAEAEAGREAGAPEASGAAQARDGDDDAGPWASAADSAAEQERSESTSAREPENSHQDRSCLQGARRGQAAGGSHQHHGERPERGRLKGSQPSSLGQAASHQASAPSSQRSIHADNRAAWQMERPRELATLASGPASASFDSADEAKTDRGDGDQRLHRAGTAPDMFATSTSVPDLDPAEHDPLPEEATRSRQASKRSSRGSPGGSRLKLTQQLRSNVGLRVRPHRLRQMWGADLHQSTARHNMFQRSAGSMPADMESRARRHGRIPPDIAAQFDAVPGADEGPQSEQQGPGQGAPKLNVQGWKVMGRGHNHEALVYLHGFNCCLVDAIKGLAQFLALANLPPHIRPFLFSWPTGTFHNYITAIKRGAESDQSQVDFVGMLSGLREAGYRSIHIMAHSMGVRVVLASIERLKALFVRPVPPGDHGGWQGDRTGHPSVDDSETDGLRLATVTLINPDTSLREFRLVGEALVQLCPLVTVYGDRKDVALTGASIVLGIHNAYVKGWRGWLHYRVEPSAGRHIYELNDSSGEPLDMDVIDNTWLDANVQGVRHMTFNLNQSIIEDLRDLLTTQRRAFQRQGRLEARGGNVFSFCVAPSYVKAK